MKLSRSSILAVTALLSLTVAADEPKPETLRNWSLTQEGRLDRSKATPDKLKAIREIEELRHVPSRCAAALVNALQDPDQRVRVAAAAGLVSLGPLAKDELGTILSCVDLNNPDTDDDVRYQLLRAIQQMGRAPYGAYAEMHRATVPILVRILRCKHQKLRDLAAQALGAAGPFAREAVPDLIGILDQREENADIKGASVRFCAIRALSEIGPLAAPAVPKMLEILRNGSRSDRGEAIRALASIGTAHLDAVPTLISLLKDASDPVQRWWVASQLARVGPGAKDAVPVLIKILEQKQPDGYDESLNWPRRVILKEHHFRLQCEALGSLGSMGPAAKAGVPILTNYAASQQFPDQMRAVAFAALARLGPVAKEAVPDLVLMLKESRIPYNVEVVLTAIGKDAVPALIELLKRGEEKTGLRALWILSRMGPDAEGARATISSLRNHPQLGETAIQVLGRLDKFRQR